MPAKPWTAFHSPAPTSSANTAQPGTTPTPASFTAASAAISRISEILYKVHSLPASAKDDSALLQVITESRAAFADAMDDDFNVPQALAAVFSLITSANNAFTEDRVGAESQNRLREFFAFVHEHLGIVPDGTSALPDDIQKMVDRRQAARDQKDWATSDQLRDELAGLGYTIDDTPYGPLVKKK